LVYATDIADLNLIELLINNGSNLNALDENCVCPLHVAINRQNDEICDYLLNKKVFINAADKQGCTPLALAVSNDYIYMIMKLLKLGADPNISDNNGLALFFLQIKIILGLNKMFKQYRRYSIDKSNLVHNECKCRK